MIFQLRDLIPSDVCWTENSIGLQVRAMHLPFRDGLLYRLRDAWEVICERAVAVRWPKDGEYEMALSTHTQRLEP